MWSLTQTSAEAEFFGVARCGGDGVGAGDPPVLGEVDADLHESSRGSRYSTSARVEELGAFPLQEVARRAG